MTTDNNLEQLDKEMAKALEEILEHLENLKKNTSVQPTTDVIIDPQAS